MTDPTKTKFATTIIAITGLISAIGGVITILHNVGVLDFGKLKKEEIKIEEVKKEEPHQEEKIKDTKQKVITTINPKVYEAAKEYNLTGYWLDKANANGKYYITHQNTGNVSFTEYSLIFGQWISTATGQGKCNNNTLEIPYETYLGTNGKFTGKISNNGKEIEGTISDFNAGMTAMLNLKKEE
ncbi:hypothetical protein ACQY1Q_02710 [Tenacibaculum sp. TC6]|uniref:hypothetical protein n=1 Tax=Tenacibaculum sp. TC6 TaxID=3423223 RepID=UPI003D35C40B